MGGLLEALCPSLEVAHHVVAAILVVAAVDDEGGRAGSVLGDVIVDGRHDGVPVVHSVAAMGTAADLLDGLGEAVAEGGGPGRLHRVGRVPRELLVVEPDADQVAAAVGPAVHVGVAGVQQRPVVDEEHVAGAGGDREPVLVRDPVERVEGRVLLVREGRHLAGLVALVFVFVDVVVPEEWRELCGGRVLLVGRLPAQTARVEADDQPAVVVLY